MIVIGSVLEGANADDVCGLRELWWYLDVR
jgi:hypothetical protein